MAGVQSIGLEIPINSQMLPTGPFFLRAAHETEQIVRQGTCPIGVNAILTSVVHSMERLALNLDDLRSLVQQLTGRGVRIELIKESLTFTGEDSPMANLMLSVMGAFAELERALIRERRRGGIALAKKRGAYRGHGRKKALSADQVATLKRRVAAGEKKAGLAREFGISRETLYQYLRTNANPQEVCDEQ
jgi:DNA invertase Pin-like site-specific DNA recombinase